MYKEVWMPYFGKILLLKREPDNVKSQFAVAVIKDSRVVDHIPYNICLSSLTGPEERLQ